MEILTGAFSLEISPYKAQNGLKTGFLTTFIRAQNKSI